MALIHNKRGENDSRRFSMANTRQGNMKRYCTYPRNAVGYSGRFVCTGGRFVEGRLVEGLFVGRTFWSEGRFVEGRFVLAPCRTYTRIVRSTKSMGRLDNTRKYFVNARISKELGKIMDIVKKTTRNTEL
jgi:hypothetical protein